MDSRQLLTILLVAAGRRTGTLVRADENGLELERGTGHWITRVAWSDVALVEVRTKEGSTATGMGVGFLAGAVVGGLMGLADGSDSEGIVQFSAGAKAGMLGTFFGLIGMLVGGIAGGADTWETAAPAVPVIGLTAAPDGRPGLAAVLRF
ncbi:hypothetical protein KDM41_08950 [bacterium]|nr:hypothetical protein [bacterium]